MKPILRGEVRQKIAVDKICAESEQQASKSLVDAGNRAEIPTKTQLYKIKSSNVNLVGRQAVDVFEDLYLLTIHQQALPDPYVRHFSVSGVGSCIFIF